MISEAGTDNEAVAGVSPFNAFFQRAGMEEFE
jgi:hypothetical protein